MENTSAARQDQPELGIRGSVGDGQDRVFSFMPSGHDDTPGRTAQVGKRDWSSALDLIAEACESVKLADNRAAAAEKYTQQVTSHYKDQLKSLEAKLAAAEKRAELSEARAKEAEDWLARLYDAIVHGFRNVLEKR